MNTRWSITEARIRLSELLHRAETEGPQTITRHGRPVAVVLGFEDYQRTRKKSGSLVEFLRNSPLLGEDLDFDRKQGPPYC
jgi:prevent-host-death family protein